MCRSAFNGLVGNALLLKSWGAGLALLAGTCGGFSQDAPAAPEPTPPSVAETLAGEVQSVFARVKNAIVRIEATDRHGKLSGTGFFVDPAGTLYTSYTIGGESTDIEARIGDKKYPAQRLFADSRSGVAVLKVHAETPFIALGESAGLEVGAPVISVGYPMDLPLSPSFGCISGFDIKYLDRYFATRHIRANVPVQRGQGGAPLLNMRGEAVGILISALDQGSACFSLPIEAAAKVHKEFTRFGELRPGWLGVGVETASATKAGSTAQVNQVNADSPGQKAGLQAGDVILSIGDHPIDSPEDVLDAAFFIAAEDEVKVSVDRDGEKLSFSLTAVDRPRTGLVRSNFDLHTFAPDDSGDLRGFPVKLEQ